MTPPHDEDSDQVPARRFDDLPPAGRIARLAWFELAAAATRRALAMEPPPARCAPMPRA
ncbi:MAG TPA: hypothetical protein VED40_08360 [Azospirillaceae bacterium]|nr:hypothetical protein [Azospirillaceae bacterium]